MRIEVSNRWDMEHNIKKLQGLPRQEALKVIYNWVKSNHISFGVFSIMVDSIRAEEINDEIEGY